jgi:ribosomal protein S18 acetylase RimI-like enzyme
MSNINIETTIKEIDKDILIINKNISRIAKISYSVNIFTNDAYILNLNVHKTQRHKGYGTLLLTECINDIKKYNINNIKLTDLSNMYRCKSNIYLKFGFNYINETDDEMILYLENR